MAIDIGDAFKIGSGNTVTDINNPAGGYSTIGGFISSVLPNVYIAAGLILLLLLIFGGLMTILNAGNPEAQEKSKNAVTAAVLGFVIIFASFWIIQIIQVLTCISILNPSF